MTVDKATLRRRLLAQRAALGGVAFAAANAALVAGLQAYLEREGFHQVFSFAAHRGEPDLAGITAPVVGLPVVAREKGQIAFYPWRAGEALTRNRYGIAEPRASGAALRADERTVILVPSVALDPAGNRLGYGGGYYDRFFAAGAGDGAVLVGVAFEEFVVARLPVERHDLRVQYLGTENGVRAVE